MTEMQRINELLQTPEQSGTRKLRPSPTSVPNADGCWCDGWGYRWRAVGEDEHGPRTLDGTVYCVCDHGERMFQEELEKRRQLRRDMLYGRRVDYWFFANIPLRFGVEDAPDGGGFTLDSSPLSKTSPGLVARLRRGVSEMEWQGNLVKHGTSPQSWLFWGGYGCGKSGLAVAYARQWIWPDGNPDFEDLFPTSVQFTTLPDLMTELRATYNRRNEDDPTEAEVLEKYRKAGILILDDMGAEQVKDTGWLEDRLYQIIGQRHSDDAATVFTSNLSPAELGARIGERNMWRIVELCGEDNIIHVEGPNLRARRTPLQEGKEGIGE